jgi:hypothetical protein
MSTSRQTFEAIPSSDGEDLHLARLCATHIIKTIAWEFEGIPQDDPQRTKYPEVFEDAHGLSLLCSAYLEGKQLQAFLGQTRHYYVQATKVSRHNGQSSGRKHNPRS